MRPRTMPQASDTNSTRNEQASSLAAIRLPRRHRLELTSLSDVYLVAPFLGDAIRGLDNENSFKSGAMGDDTAKTDGVEPTGAGFTQFHSFRAALKQMY